LVVASHALVRAGVSALVAEQPGLRVVADAADLESAVHVAERVHPDVVLHAGAADAAAIATLRRALPRCCIMCLDERGELAEAGALCVRADADLGELCSMLGTALGGRCGGCAFRDRCPAPENVALSRREKQVALHVAHGKSSKQIAAALGIGLRTVNTYRESLARKLGASSAAVLTRYVLEHGLSFD
jgi:DNA-binding NarL/FixJ family response regulator